MRNSHCVKSVQIRSFFWSLFSCIRTEYGEIRSIIWSIFFRIRENMDQKKLRIWTLFTQCMVSVEIIAQFSEIKFSAHFNLNHQNLASQTLFWPSSILLTYLNLPIKNWENRTKSIDVVEAMFSKITFYIFTNI